MAELISIHSHKGGSGKTLVTMNLATLLAKRGKRVAIIDLDLSAPSLHTYVPNHAGKKVNDYLLDGATPADIMFDATYLLGENIPGKLFMALADISGDAIAKINQRDQDALLNDLFLLMELVRKKLPNDPWNVDYILIDTSPGLTTHAINGVAITNHVIMIMRLINADVDGTRHFLETLHKSVQPKASIIVNQIPSQLLADGGKELVEKLIDERLTSKLGTADVEFAGILENDENVIQNEFKFILSNLDSTDTKQRPIHILSQNSQEFAHNFEKVMDRIIE